MRNKCFFLIFLSTYAYSFNNLTPRPERKPMRTSVIVPCIARHFFWLSGLLESYQNQTVVPDEVVISLCEVEKLNPKEINDLENGRYDFDLKIIRKKGKILDGNNRTIAMDNSTGDLLIFSDADDLPHPQRVEISKYIFEHYDVDHMLHTFSHDRAALSLVDIHNIQILRFKSLHQIIKSPHRITTGSPVFVRKVANRLKWQAIKDREHTHNVYRLFKNNIVVPLPLILYRIHLSSHSPNREIAAKKLLIWEIDRL